MKRKAFPLRLSPKVYDEVRRWADDDLRSMNAQIEYLLKRALEKAGRPAAGAGRDPDQGD